MADAPSRETKKQRRDEVRVLVTSGADSAVADYVESLIDQRDELLAVLKELLHASPASGWEQKNAHARAVAAIAKAEVANG